MPLVLVVFLILVSSLFILFMAMSMFRRQRLLDEKKAEYLTIKRKNSHHWSLFRKSQANIDRIKSLCRNKESELFTLLNEIENIKKDIKDTLVILKKETKQVEGDLAEDLGRIIVRRKTLVKNSWQSMNGKKVAFIERLKEIQGLVASTEREKSVKDQEYLKWNETKQVLARIKREFGQIHRSRFISFEKKSGK